MTAPERGLSRCLWFDPAGDEFVAVLRTEPATDSVDGSGRFVAERVGEAVFTHRAFRARGQGLVMSVATPAFGAGRRSRWGGRGKPRGHASPGSDNCGSDRFIAWRRSVRGGCR